jgi:8-oxo-dGTP pyrophosphatase MutT (NUDIX family)
MLSTFWKKCFFCGYFLKALDVSSVGSTLLQQLKLLEFAYPASTDWKTIKQDRRFEADWRFAAVLVPILDRSEQAILLTKRSSRLAYQPGHVSFPGGRPQENDPDVASTALREASEEICLRSEDVQVLGCLALHKTRKNKNVIVPVIGVVRPSAKWSPCSDEVDDVFEFGFDVLLNPNLPKQYEGGERAGSWYWSGQTQDIWGVTARILMSLAAALRDRG